MPANADLMSILATLAPIFILICIGYCATKYGIIPREGIKYLGMFVINIALPCMLFKALTARSIAETFNPDYLFVYALGSLLTLLLGIFLGRVLRHKSLSVSTILAMGSSFSNSGFIGYPIILQILGPATIVPVALSIIVENVFMLPIALLIASANINQQSLLHSISHCLLDLFKNPIIWGIFLGVSYSALALSAPVAVLSVIDMFGNTSAPIALFTIGGSLVGLRLKGMALDIAQVIVGKLLIHPMMIILALTLTPNLSPLYQLSAILLACMPMFSIYPILGEKYGIQDQCAAAMLATTCLSFVSISVWVFIL
ncbi:MAG: AEC family transporter [Pseudomonadales bacterium]|nr:AEC family transporter [Pseudomonadales bacterium]